MIKNRIEGVMDETLQDGNVAGPKNKTPSDGAWLNPITLPLPAVPIRSAAACVTI